MQYYEVKKKVEKYINTHKDYTLAEVNDFVQQGEDHALAKDLAFYVSLALNDIKSQNKSIPQSELYL